MCSPVQHTKATENVYGKTQIVTGRLCMRLHAFFKIGTSKSWPSLIVRKLFLFLKVLIRTTTVRKAPKIFQIYLTCDHQAE